MDSNLFKAGKIGDLVKITVPYPEWAFLPHPLPPRQWDFPQFLWPLVANAKQALGKLDGIGQTLVNPELLLSPLQQREALRSSSLEGTYASPQELLLFELEPRKPASSSDRTNAWLEVSNYRQALRDGFIYLTDAPISLHLIRNLHERLLLGVRGQDKRPGEFRQKQVHVGSDRRYVPPPGERVQECLDALSLHLEPSRPFIDPLVHCYMVHYQFEAIHPFLDGNGRVGRLLLALMTAKLCGLSKPWLYMSPYFERYKDEYIDRLFKASSIGDWEGWFEFCLRGTIEQAQDAIARCEKLGDLKQAMQSRISEGSVRLFAILEDLFEAPLTTVPRVREKFQVTYPTAKADIERLVLAGVLAPIPEALRPKVYYSPEIFRVAYGDSLDD